MVAGTTAIWARDDVRPIPSGHGADASPAATPGSAYLGQPFTLIVGGSVVLDDGLLVTFATVVGDSRCPTHVECVWEGNAEIVIDVVSDPEDPASLHLNTNPGFPTTASYSAYTMELLGLDLYPGPDVSMDEPYRSRLVISESGTSS